MEHAVYSWGRKQLRLELYRALAFSFFVALPFIMLAGAPTMRRKSATLRPAPKRRTEQEKHTWLQRTRS